MRALAIAFVMFFHWAPHALARIHGIGDWIAGYTGLWSGVDLFFCVSGYVITRSLVDRPADRSTLWAFAKPFYIRRIFRLWPGAWAWMAAAVVLSVWFNATGLFGTPRNTARDAAMALLNVANFHDFQCLSDHTCGALRIYWSLSLEEQFYWIFPCLIFFCTRRVLVAVLIAAAAAQIFLVRPMAFMVETPGLLWLIRTDAICLGALAALAVETPVYLAMKEGLTRHPAATRTATLLLLIVLAAAAGPKLGLTRATGILAAASALLVCIASCDRALLVPRLKLLEPLLLWLGSRSFSLYLVHDVGGTLAAELRARVSLPFGGVLWALYGLSLTVGITCVFAELNFRWLESPLQRAGRRIAARHQPLGEGRRAVA